MSKKADIGFNEIEIKLIFIALEVFSRQYEKSGIEKTLEVHGICDIKNKIEKYIKESEK